MNGQIIELRSQTLKDITSSCFKGMSGDLFVGGWGGENERGVELLHSFVPWACLAKKKPRFPNTRLIQTRHYYGQFPLSVGN